MTKDQRIVRLWLPTKQANKWALPLLMVCLLTPVSFLFFLEAAPTATVVALITWLAAMTLGWLWILFMVTKVAVGEDGVLIERKKDRRFIPFADIAEAKLVDDVMLRIILHSGESVDLYTSKNELLGQKEPYLQRVDELFARIHQGAVQAEEQRRQQGEATAESTLRDRAFVLLRAGEHAGATEVPYRVVPAPNDEELWQVVESPNASATERAAAASLLRGDAEEATLQRLRIATEGAVEPGLRRFLRIATDSDADGEALVEALAELEEGAEEQLAAAQREGA